MPPPPPPEEACEASPQKKITVTLNLSYSELRWRLSACWADDATHRGCGYNTIVWIIQHWAPVRVDVIHNPSPPLLV